MSSLTKSAKRMTNTSIANISMAILLTTTVLCVAGCSTTQDFRPTASVMVGT